MNNITAVGLMSGTSLDGLDICAVNFKFKNNKWQFKILKTETIPYSTKLKQKLSNTTQLTAQQLLQFNSYLGELFGQLVKQFLKSNQLKADYICSHGHTVFHQPQKGFTLQIGCGQQIAIITNKPVVYNFRAKDVALGGQGAPLVPIGDKLLFGEFDACINLGGIANISFQDNNERIAFDICPFNMGLNYLANQINLEYDEFGAIAKSGKLIPELIKNLNKLKYYNLPYPKSLGVEWFTKHCLPLIANDKYTIQDKLHTLSQHIAEQLSIVINKVKGNSVLISGGGVYNTFVIDLLKTKTSKNIIIPSKEIINFKEALIFAFLGVLKVNNQVNVLKSVTGASKNSVSGIIVIPD